MWTVKAEGLGPGERDAGKHSAGMEDKKMCNKEKFESSEFAIQLMAKGSFIDNSTGDGTQYLVEAFTIRLNYVALNAWILSETMNCRECYDTDKEWEDHKAEYQSRLEAWDEKIVDILGIDPNAGSVSIKQAQSEVFTVVHIRKIAHESLADLAPKMYNALKMAHKACGPAEIWKGETQKFLEEIEKILSELDDSFDPQASLEELVNAND